MAHVLALWVCAKSGLSKEVLGLLYIHSWQHCGSNTVELRNSEETPLYTHMSVADPGFE